MIQEDRKFWKLLLFTIPTLGIYNIWFWYKLTQDLNEIDHEDKRLLNYILVCFLTIITFGIYRWVWFFWTADHIRESGMRNGIKLGPGPGTTLAIRLFGTFIIIGPIISSFMVVRNMNKLAHEYNLNFKKNTKVSNTNIDKA